MTDETETPICPGCGKAHEIPTMDEVSKDIQDCAAILLDQGAKEAHVILGLLETAADGFIAVNETVTLEAWLELATVVFNESQDCKVRSEAKQRLKHGHGPS